MGIDADMFEPSARRNIFYGPLPTADAVGYISFAAARLLAKRADGLSQPFTRSINQALPAEKSVLNFAAVIS